MRKMAGTLALAALVAAPALADNAKPRGGGSGGGSGSAGSRHPSGGSSSSSSSSGSSSSSSGSSSSYSPSSAKSRGPSTPAQARHPRPGTGTGYRYPGCCYGGYYPGYDPWYPWYYPSSYAYGPYWGAYYYGYWPYGAYYSMGVSGGGYSSGGGGSDSGGVRLMADPDDARVYVDGYYAGKVEDFDGLFQKLHLPRGRHEILVKKDGYETRRFRVYSEPGMTIKIEADLEKGEGEAPIVDLTNGRGGDEPERPAGEEWGSQEPVERPAPASDRARSDEAPATDRLGQLRLDVRPGDATVYVDGEFRGTARESTTLVLRPGFHRIEIVRPGFRTEGRDVEVRPGETRQVDVELQRP
jgi:hypothetical protein